MNDMTLRIDENGMITGVLVNGVELAAARIRFEADVDDEGMYRVRAEFYARSIRTEGPKKEVTLRGEDDHPLRRRLGYLGEDDEPAPEGA